ncbi:M6 family metalloprotease domain-containing protein [Streptomyces flavofungini]|uniref:M6 family metalloprotease domain-containing protein n=1 Tax=Streptomyces flavofungini TaxID=68200 RepID=A0ABS0X9Q5_9ACTN|nr:M6 family metalloprotease domain-containing protein [Streptomyces flavofungini]MBJ3809930.1 M6 family metalloprotease domain-containing protein [Streptomyces flavofungini]GHC53998.1 peptidase M6 [Streptomyces flavofungini]
MPAQHLRLRPLTAAFTLAICLTAPTAGASPGPAAPAADCALPGRTGWTDEGHDTDPRQFQRATGTRKTLTLFVDFPDAPATDSTRTYARQLGPAAGWLKRASHGRARLDVTSLHRWIRMPADSASYGFERGLTFEAHEKYVRDAVTAADPHADFSRYDMVYVVPTRAAAAISFSPTYLFDPGTPGVSADGRRIRWGVTFGQDLWRWGRKVVAHETGHTFGLPDLYAFSGDTHRYVGGWDVMGDIAGRAPQHLGWHAWKLGWIRDAQVACLPGSGRRTVRLTPVEREGGTKIAVLRTGGTTAYVAESRRAEGHDRNACSTGVLIYKVDSAAETGEGPVRVMNADPSTTPPTGCTPLDQAAHAPGRTFTDPDTGARITVVEGGRKGDTVRLGRP